LERKTKNNFLGGMAEMIGINEIWDTQKGDGEVPEKN